MSSQATSIKGIEEKQEDLNRNIKEANLRSIGYAAQLLQTFADIKPDDNKYAAINTVDYFINKFGAELAQYDKERLDNIIGTYKKLITTDASELPDFNECTDDQKLAVFMAMRAMGIESNKEDYMKLINDNPNFSPFLKAVGFYSLLAGGELENWSLNDLEQIGISDWPERAKYELVEKLARDNIIHDNLTDISNSVSLSNNKFFKDASPEIKRLLIFTLFENVNNGRPNNNLRTSPIITIASDSLDDANKYKLISDIEDKHGVRIELEGEKGKVRYQDSRYRDEVALTMRLEKIVKSSHNVELADMDKLAHKLNLDDSPVNTDLCIAFFRRLQAQDLGEFTPGVILKRNWPTELKKVAYECLPAYYKTEDNLKAIFELDQINLLIDKAVEEGTFDSSKDAIRNRISNYINMLKPNFTLNDDNQKKIEDLEAKLGQAAQVDDFRNLLKNGKLYGVIEEATFKQFDDFVAKLGELMDTEEKAEQLDKYLSDPGRSDLPRFIDESQDPALISFVKNNKKLADQIRWRENRYSVALVGGGAWLGAAASCGTLLGLVAAKVPAISALTATGLGLSCAAFLGGGLIVGALIGAAIYGIYKLVTQKLMNQNKTRGIKKIKEMTEQVKDRLQEARKQKDKIERCDVVKVDVTNRRNLCQFIGIKHRDKIKLVRQNAIKTDISNSSQGDKTTNLISDEDKNTDKSSLELKDKSKDTDRSNIREPKFRPLSKSHTIGGKKGKGILNKSLADIEGNINRTKAFSETHEEQK